MKGKTLNRDEVAKIKGLINRYEGLLTDKEIGKLADVSRETISRIRHRYYDAVGSTTDSLYDSLKKQGLCDEDIKLAVAMIMRLKEKKK